MAITCALDNQKLSALYKVIYADLKTRLNAVNDQEGAQMSFDLDSYMNGLFADLIESSEEDTVLNFMQMVPAMVGQILMTVPGFEEVGDVTYIRKKSNEFRNADNGYQAMRDFFSLDIDKDTLAKIVKNNDDSKNIPEAIVDPKILSEAANKRYKPSSAVTSTFQQFIEQDPDKVVVEEPDSNKNRIYNVLNRISELSSGGVADVEYPTKDGGSKIIKLKTLVLDKIPKDQQTEKTKEYILIYNSIVKEGNQKNKDQLGPKEIVALVITDEKGNYVYFDEEGNITNAKQGKLVYQMLRSARKDGKKYTVKDVYNKEDQIQSAATIVGNRYKDSTVKPTTAQFQKEVDEVETQQQKEFKAIYDLRQSVIGPKGKSQLLSITGTSEGVFNTKVKGQGSKSGTLLSDAISEFSESQKKSIMKSIEIYREDYEDDQGKIPKGFSTIIIGDKKFIVDRPLIKSQDFANRLATALTDSNLSVEDKMALFEQFFPKKSGLPNRGKTFFLSLDKEANLVLTYGSDIREVAFRVQKNLKEEGKYKGDLDGLYGKRNEEFTKVLNQEKMNLKVSNKNLTMVPENKDTLIELLLKGNVTIDKETQTMERVPLRIATNKQNADNGIYLDYDIDKGKLVERNYTNFLLSDDIELKVFLPGNTTLSVYNKYMHFDLPSKLSDQASKVQEKQTVEEVIPDAEYNSFVDEGIISSDRITSLAQKVMVNSPLSPRETQMFVDKTTEVNQRIVELSGQDNSTKSQKTDQAKSNIVENTADPKVPNPSTTKGISGLFNLDRSIKLPQGVTQSQLDAAKKWWDNSPLRKYIDYEHQHNIVNSDAFARFILAGRDLISEGKIGTVVLYGNGNFVDLYHESWHVFSQLFLTKQQKIDLYNEVINTIPKFKSLKGVDTIEEFENLSEAQKSAVLRTYEQIEEYLAEEFRKYAKNPKAKKNAPKRNSLFRQMLNYLKELFGKFFNRMDVSQDVMEIDNVKELFENLYLSSEDPSVLNKYLKNLNIDQDNGINYNALFDGYLNRGIKQASNKKEDALNRQDSNSITQAIDSLYSEIVDEVVAERKLSGNVNTKSAVLKLFNDPKNRDVAYGLIKERLQDKLDQFRIKLGPISNTDFNSLNTLSDLRQNAVATIISKKGDNKYIFLRSQIEDFENLNADTKDGLREKGKIYYGIRIVGDYYSHKTIKDKTKDFADIIIVDDLAQARAQFSNYINRIGGEKNVNITDFEVNVEAFQNANRPLTSEEEALLDNIRVLQTALNNWNNTIKYHRENSTFDITKQSYKEISPGVEEAQDETEAVKDQEELEEEERKVDTEEAAADKIYGQPTNIKSLAELADSEVIYVLKSLFKVENGKYVRDRFGFKQLSSFKHTWNTIAAILENVKTPQEMYDKLAEAALDYPEIAQLVSSKIPNPAVENAETEYDLTTSFWKTFNKHRVRYIQLYAIRAGNDFVTEVINASIDVSNVKRLFQSKFRAETESKYTTREKNITRLNLDSIIRNFKLGKNFDTYGFLKAIGFYFDSTQDEKNSPLRRDLEGYSNYMKYGIPYIYSIVEGAQKLSKQKNLSKEKLDFLEKFRTEPLQTMMDGIPPKIIPGLEEGTSQKTQVERILGLEIKHGAVGSTYSVLNPEGNKVQEHTLNNGATYLVDALNSAEKLEDLWFKYDSNENINDGGKDLSMGSFLDPSANSWTLRSQILKSMFNMTDEERSKRAGKELEYMMVSGTQVAAFRLTEQKSGKSAFIPKMGETTSNLDEYGKFLQEFHTMLKKGVQEFLRPGSKSASYGVKLNGGFVSTDKRINPNLYVDIESFVPGNIGEEKAIKNIVIPYIAAEVERIRRYQETPEAKNYVGYNKPFRSVEGEVKAAGESFVYFDSSLRTETKNAILKAIPNSDIKLEDYLETDPDLENKIVEDIKEYFEELTDQLYGDLLSKVDYIDPSLMKVLEDVKISELDKKKTLLKAFNYNAWIHNVEMTILFNGDIAQMDHDKEGLHKRTSGLPSNGEGFRTDHAAKEFINKIWHSKNTYAKVKGFGDFHYDGTYSTAVMKDVVRVSKYIDDIEAGLREDYEKRYAEQLKSNPKATKALIDERVATDLKPYTEMEEADGAGYITFDAYRTLKKLQGNWSEAQEELYQRVLESYITGEEISAVEISRMFPIYKVQHYGHLMGTKLPVTAMHKFALTPLIPTVFKNSELERLHDEMMKQGIQYALFSSGSKVGSVTSTGSYDEVYVSDKSSPFYQKSLKSEFKLTPNIIHLANLKEASQVSDKFKGEVVFMTQLRKMIVDGMIASGTYTNPRFKKYLSNYDTLLEKNRQIIEEDIKLSYGITQSKDGSYKIENINKFINLIHRELERKDIPDHLISRINANRNGNFRVDPSIHIEAETVENLIFNISKKLIKQKMKGEALVQVPSTFTNGMMTGIPEGIDVDMPKTKADYDALYKKYLGTNTLPFYQKGKGKNGNTASAGIAIALQGDFLKLLDFKHNDGQVIGTRERLNEMIKNDQWLNTADNRRAVTVVGVRIPTQQKSFMESYEVFEFLPKEAGSLILMPSEAVAKSGSDYDVDKVTLFMPSLDQDGVIKTVEISDEQFQSLKPAEKAEYVRRRRFAIQNDIISTISEMILDKDFYADLVRPTGTNILQPASEKNQGILDKVEYNRKDNFLGHEQRKHTKKEGTTVISPSVTLTPRYNVYKSIRNLVGKSVLGIAMNEIAANSIFNAADATMPATWSKDANAMKKDKRLINAPVRLLFPHNKSKDGRISLAKLDTVDGLERISEIYANAANGLVDIETDDWISNLQVNSETANVIFFMISAGVPVEHIRLFLMNPLIRRYGELQRIKSGIFGVLSGRASQANKGLLRWEAAVEALAEAVEGDPELVRDEFTLNTNYKKAPSITSRFVNENGEFDLSVLESAVDKNELGSPEAIAGFYHYLEIQAYIKDLGALKQDTKPDNNVFNSLQQVQARDSRLENLKNNGNVDPKLVETVMKDSILRTFFDNELVSDIVKEVMPLRNNDEVTSYLRSLLSNENELYRIKAKYEGFTGEQRFVTEYKNGVLNFIYQNFMSNLLDKNGVMVNIPSEFRGKKVVKTDEVISKGVKLENGVFYINEEIVEKDFADKRYLAVNAKEPNSYLNRDLPHFREEDPFPTKSGFYKYLFEREYLRNVYKIEDIENSLDFKKILKEFSVASDYSSRQSYYKNRAYVELLSRHALINSFNRHALMKQGAASYTQKVLDTVELLKKVPGLTDRYPILDQIVPFTDVRGNYVITLNDQPILKGDLAETYQQNIRELADPTIKKLGDPVENKRVTDVFRMFAKALIYQHGVGKTKYGINQALPQEEFEMIMSAAVPSFMKLHIESGFGLMIVDQVLFDKERMISEEAGTTQAAELGTAFKNYVVDVDVYNAEGLILPETPSVSEQEDDAQDRYVAPPASKPVTSEPVVTSQAEIIDRSSIPESVISIEIPDPMSDFFVSFTDEKGKKLEVYVDNDAEGNPVIQLNNAPVNKKGKRPNRATVDALARKYLGDGLVDFMLGWKALSKEDEGIIKRYVLGVPLRGMSDSKFYNPATIEEINQQYEDKISSEIKEGVDKYLKPFAQEALEKTVQRLEEDYKKAKVEKTKTKLKIVIDDYKKALSRFGTTQPQSNVKKGVLDLFSSNAELSSIGTPEQYSEYLDSIFPNSQVKDIVYHGTGIRFDSFSKRSEYDVIFFADLDYAQTFADKYSDGKSTINGVKQEPVVITAIVNIENPLKIDGVKFQRRRMKPGIGYAEGTEDAREILSKNSDKDGLIGKDNSKIDNHTYVVRDSSQTHILGSKQDIREFENFVSKSQPTAPVIVETPKQEGQYEFEFSNGFKVYTPFQLNDQQKEALFFMEEFYKNSDELNNMMSLEGYAGTGKTTIMSLFVKYLQNRNQGFVLSSPTHKANQVTKKNNPEFSEIVITLPKALGIKPSIDFSNPNSYGVEDLIFGGEADPIIDPGSVLIIDEASMVTDVLYDMLVTIAEQKNIKIVFMGDPAQLPPVYKDPKKEGELSPVFTNTQGVELTKVERTGDNPILYEATRLREGEQLTYKSDEKNGKGISYLNATDVATVNEIMNTKIKQLIEGDNKLSFRILAYTNAEVASYNTLARQAAFGDKAQEQYLEGEIVMGQYNRNYSDGFPVISNSVDYKVENVEKVKKTVTVTSLDSNNKKITEKITVDLYELTLRDLILGELTIVKVVDMSQDPKVIGKLVQEIRRMALAEKGFWQMGQVKEAFEMSSKRNDLETSFLFPANIYIDQTKPYTTEWISDKEYKKLNKDQKRNYRNSSPRSIDYGYAHTIHKSQGGTYNEVMVIDAGINNIYSRNNSAAASQKKSQLRYVAVSRASDYVYYVVGQGGQVQAQKTFTPNKPIGVTPTVRNTTKPTKEGTMKFSFQDRQGNWLQRDDVMSDNTFDAILEGARTATTRYIEDPSYDYWLSTKKGDVIRWWSGGKTGEGEFVDVEVTRDPQPIDWSQMDDQEIMEWSIKEGWDGYKMERIKKQGTTRLKGIQIEFSKLETAEERAKRENDEANDKDNTCSSI